MAGEDSEKSELVQVGNYPDALSAEAVRACLEMEGVVAHVFDGEVAMMLGWYGKDNGGAKVMVPKAQAERARVLLADLEHAADDRDVAIEDEITPGGRYCQRCHSRRLRCRTTWKRPQGFWLRLVPRCMLPSQVCRCRDCGFAVRS